MPSLLALDPRTVRTTMLAVGALSIGASVAFPSSTSAQDAPHLGIDGLSGITAATPFDPVYLNASFPSLRWESENRRTEHGVEQVLHAGDRGERWFSLASDGRGRIASIDVNSATVKNWLGPQVGDPFGPLRKNDQLGNCSPGQEELSGKVICGASESPLITYVFSGRWNGPDGQMPPSATLDHWALTRISWRPDRFAHSLLPTLPGAQSGPSYDCSHASGSIEQMICDDYELSDLDRRLAMAFDAALKAAPPESRTRLRTFQKGWIKARNECWKSATPRSCVLQNYQARIAELETSMSASAPSDLRGTSWSGLRIAGDMIPLEIDISLTFNADGQISGSSGCNRFFAAYEQDGARLTFGAVGGTRMLCPELAMTAERRFLAALESVSGWAIRDSDLILFGNGAELTFARVN